MTSTGDATGVINHAPHPDETHFSTASMPKLSPAAKTVLDAFLGDAENTGLQVDDLRENVAAALRAAVDEVISSIPPPCGDYDEYAQGFLGAHVKYRGQLLEIAADLEAQ